MASRVTLSGLTAATIASDPQEAIQKSYIDTYAAPGHMPASGYGLLAWSCDPCFLGQAFTTVASTAYFTKIYFPKTVTITALGVGVSTAGVTATGYHGLSLHDATGTLLAASTTDPALFTTLGWRSKAIASTVMQGGTFGWIGLLATTSTTRPAFAGGNSAGAGAILNGGGTRFGTKASQSSLVTFTVGGLSTLTTSGYIWAAAL
jgi:hypothetical protein